MTEGGHVFRVSSKRFGQDIASDKRLGAIHKNIKAQSDFAFIDISTGIPVLGKALLKPNELI